MTDDGRFYRLPSRDQTTLWAPSLRQAVQEEEDVLALDAAVEQLDLSALEAQYSRVGHPAYPPKVLLKVLIYGYAIGLRASRQLERACRLDDAFRFLAHGLRPDHTALCRFRHDHPQEFKQLFVQTVRLCQDAGLVKLGNVAVDGTKLRANRSARGLAQVRELAEQAYQEAEAADADIVAHGAHAPRQEPARGAGAAEQTGSPTERSSAPTAADAECRFMKTQDGIKPAYNAQVAVDSAHGVIVGQEVVSAPADQGQLPPMVAQVIANCNAVPQAVSADGGYLTTDSMERLERQGVAAYLPLASAEASKFTWDEAGGGYVCPHGHVLKPYRVRDGRQVYRTTRCKGCPDAQRRCGVKQRFKEISVPLPETAMGKLARRMQSPAGQAIYAARKQIVEPVFGDFKHNGGFARLLLRGRRGAAAELSLKCIARNLRIWGRQRFAPGADGELRARVTLTQNLVQLSRSMVSVFSYHGLWARLGGQIGALVPPFAQMPA